MARGGGSQSTTTAANTGGNQANNGNDGNRFASLEVSDRSSADDSSSPFYLSSVIFGMTAGNSAGGSNYSRGRNDRPSCKRCGVLGHTMDKCYKLHGYPPGYKFKSRNPNGNQGKPIANQASFGFDHGEEVSSESSSLSNSQCQQLIALLSSQLQDTGATHHVCHNIEYFASFDSAIFAPYVTLPNGQHVSISRVGTVRLSSHMLLKKVLYVPNFKYNLLSVSSLTKSANYSLVFSTDCCVIQDSSRALQIGMGKRIGNLYYLVLPDSRAHSIAVCNSVIPTSDIMAL
ncbi:hypothetical protein LWI29_033294 [Acer saccharum]|uniref:Retrovirus-related Pol polyprotein from transposon TNT 1-94-like beta-barrel domain-containing protein n=1 Tax=Acer saccharum TaxID=4024 RepID=A0AA39RUS8_ACESA|nr:hypothetical protein LWI29_033294 [Acer saccharum]